MELENTQRFWTALFEENGLIPKLPEIAEEPDGRSLPTKEFGQVKVKASPASAMGDNFLSDTFIVEAKTVKDVQSQTGFIKVLPLNTVMRQAASSGGVYNREIAVYRDLFPLLRGLLGDRPIPLDVSDLYYARLDGDDNTCVLLEDLKAKGFKVTDKTHGCDFHHARLAVISLAHYHSLTMTALKNWTELSSTTGELTVNYPDQIKFMKEKSMLDNDPVAMLKGWLETLIAFTEEVQRPDLTQWLKRDIQENLAEILKLETLESAGEMACILHGDYWNNNFMFHYDANGRPDALRMVDFQIVRIGHPLNDLLYFLYSSTRPELREKHLMGLLRLYFLTLKADLELLGKPLDYSWNEFEEDFKKRSRAGFLMGGMAMSFILSKSVVSDLQDIDKEAKSAPVSEEPKAMGEHGMTVEMEEKMTNMIKNPSQKWSSNKILTDRMIKLVDEIKKLNSY